MTGIKDYVEFCHEIHPSNAKNTMISKGSAHYVCEKCAKLFGEKGLEKEFLLWDELAEDTEKTYSVLKSALKDWKENYYINSHQKLTLFKVLKTEKTEVWQLLKKN